MNTVLVVAARSARDLAKRQVFRRGFACAALAIGASFFVAKLTIGNWDRTILDVGLSAIEIVSVFGAIAVGSSLAERAGAVPENRPPDDVTSPGALLVGRYLGLVAIAFANATLLFGVLAIVLALADFGPSAAAVSAALLISVEASLIAAFAVLLSVVSSAKVAAFLSFVLFLAGHVTHELQALGERSGRVLTKAGAAALYYLLPDLELFNVKPTAANRLVVPAAFTTSTALYGLCYAGLVLLAAVLVLERRAPER